MRYRTLGYYATAHFVVDNFLEAPNPPVVMCIAIERAGILDMEGQFEASVECLETALKAAQEQQVQEDLTVSDTIEQRRGSNINLDDSIEDGSGEDDAIFIIVIAFIMVGSSRESIRFTHRSSGYMCDGEMETREV